MSAQDGVQGLAGQTELHEFAMQVLANLHLPVTKFSSAKSLIGALDQTQVR
jgi:hypothetical protein